MLVLSPTDDQKLEGAMTSLRTRWDKLSKESPTIPPRIYAQHRSAHEQTHMTTSVQGGR